MTTFDYFDASGDFRLKEIWNRKGAGGQTFSKFDYTYDVLGQIKQWTQQTDNNTPNVLTMDYDPEQQLLSALIAPQGGGTTKDYAYGYDDAGNRTSEEVDTLSPSRVATVTASSYNNRTS